MTNISRALICAGLSVTATCTLAQSASGTAPPKGSPASKCSPPETLLVAMKGKTPRLLDAILVGFHSENCSSVIRTMQQLVSSTAFGGRNLQGQDLARAVAEGEAELAVARRDPALQSAVRAATENEPDATMRQIREAAILGDRDYTKARSLLIFRMQTGNS